MDRADPGKLGLSIWEEKSGHYACYSMRVICTASSSGTESSIGLRTRRGAPENQILASKAGPRKFSGAPCLRISFLSKSLSLSPKFSWSFPVARHPLGGWNLQSAE
jgi:hypothetical protein